MRLRQISRDIGIKLTTKSWYLTTTRHAVSSQLMIVLRSLCDRSGRRLSTLRDDDGMMLSVDGDLDVIASITEYQSATNRDPEFPGRSRPTLANGGDVSVAPAIIPDAPGEVYADRAYDAWRSKRPSKRRKAEGFCAKVIAGWPPQTWRLRQVRARIEKIFGPGSAASDFLPMRWIGLAKARLQIHLAVIAYNINAINAFKPPERVTNPWQGSISRAQAHRSSGDVQIAGQRAS